jgi:cytoskeletal protein RodZ
MNPTFRKVALIAATLGLLLSLFLALRPDDDETAAPATTAAETQPPAATTTAPTTTEEEEAPPPPTTTAPPPEPGPQIVDIDATTGEIARTTVEQGRRVVLNVTADVADHVHVHGYDLMADVAPGQPAKISFVADVPGRFEIELEDSGIHIAELEVRP